MPSFFYAPQLHFWTLLKLEISVFFDDVPSSRLKKEAGYDLAQIRPSCSQALPSDADSTALAQLLLCMATTVSTEVAFLDVVTSK